METNNSNSHSAIVTGLFSIAAAALFIPLFITRGIGPFDFWWWMSVSLVILITTGVFFDRDFRAVIRTALRDRTAFKIGWGMAAALALYVMFAIGNMLSRHIFDFAGGNINAVYGFRGEASSLRIALLMAIVIGPGEELFWRFFLQRRLADRFGPWIGFAAATSLYAAVHIASGNLMLVLAALVCGLFWGFIAMRFRSPLINMVSHTVWDIAVFIFFPFTA